MSDLAKNAVLEGKLLPSYLNASVIQNKPICNSKGHYMAKSYSETIFLLISSTDLVTCVFSAPQKGSPLMQMSLPWLGSGFDTEEPLRNAEAAGKQSSLCVHPLQMQPFLGFSNGFDNCRLFLQPD